MEQFASGWKRNYYGKGDIIAYRLQPGAAVPLFGANVKLLVYGDAFWPTYTTGDNTGLIATDSMKNFVQRETKNFTGSDLEGYCEFLGSKFLGIYPQVQGVQVSATEIPYSSIPGQREAFAPSGPERLTARVEIDRNGTVEAASGITGFRMVRLSGSAFFGFVRDQYTTLPDIHDRPLHMWLDLEWMQIQAGTLAGAVRDLIHNTFGAFESGSIQQIIYQVGTKMLSELPAISEVHLEANNRTWDNVAEDIYTDARPALRVSGFAVAAGELARWRGCLHMCSIRHGACRRLA